ncbi:MAG TPA: magnesium transporter [Thermoleophilaceae bacterium]|nr:magnesium transporter [Thermoleophilaceae bacterium]
MGRVAAAAPRLGIARELATGRVPRSRPNRTAADVRAEVSGASFDYAGAVAVLDGRRLVGVATIEDVLGAPGDALMADLMDRAPPTIGSATDEEAVVWETVMRGEATVAVEGRFGEFRGLIPPSRLLGVLLHEHDEDLARLGGYLAGTVEARGAAQEGVADRLWHRIPWLLVGLAGAMASAVIVGGFEEQLEKTVLLAFFLPAVVYMADAVGTQTETVLIRGLSVGVELRKVVWRELATGGVVGLLMAAAFLPFALLVFDDGHVAVAVGLALFASCSIATLVAMVFPWLFHRFGADPAFGSGPLATVVQDLLSIAVYLVIATIVVGA